MVVATPSGYRLPDVFRSLTHMSARFGAYGSIVDIFFRVDAEGRLDVMVEGVRLPIVGALLMATLASACSTQEPPVSATTSEPPSSPAATGEPIPQLDLNQRLGARPGPTT